MYFYIGFYFMVIKTHGHYKKIWKVKTLTKEKLYNFPM